MLKLNRNFESMKIKVHEEMDAFNKVLADPPSSEDHRRSLTEEQRQEYALEIHAASKRVNGLQTDDFSRPLVHNLFLFKAIVHECGLFFSKLMANESGTASKTQIDDFHKFETRLTEEDKKRELDFFLTTERVLQALLEFETLDRVKFKMVVANVYNWFEKTRKQVDTVIIEEGASVANYIKKRLSKALSNQMTSIETDRPKNLQEAELRLQQAEKKLLDKQRTFNSVFGHEGNPSKQEKDD
jgi:hypothetical protein